MYVIHVCSCMYHTYTRYVYDIYTYILCFAWNSITIILNVSLWFGGKRKSLAVKQENTPQQNNEKHICSCDWGSRVTFHGLTRVLAMETAPASLHLGEAVAEAWLYSTDCVWMVGMARTMEPHVE